MRVFINAAVIIHLHLYLVYGIANRWKYDLLLLCSRNRKMCWVRLKFIFQKDRLYISNGLLTSFNIFWFDYLDPAIYSPGGYRCAEQVKSVPFQMAKKWIFSYLSEIRRKILLKSKTAHTHILFTEESWMHLSLSTPVCACMFMVFSFEITTTLEKHMNQNSHMDTINNHMHRKLLYQWFFF